MRLIDADALNKRMYHDAFETDSNMQKWDSGCWIRYKMFEKAIEDAPTIDPTLYGYKIEHLALIAKVIEKEGVTPEIAVQILGDIQSIFRMLIDELQERIRTELEPWKVIRND